MSFASSPVSDVLAGYVAGRVKAERVVAVVAAAYYGDEGRGTKDGLRALIEVIERAAPGIAELARTADAAGFEVKLAERPFPKPYAAELERAARAALSALTAEGVRGEPPAPLGFLGRVRSALGRMFR